MTNIEVGDIDLPNKQMQITAHGILTRMVAKVHVIVPAEWCNNPSTQRWPSAYSSAQRWWSAYPCAQRQSSAYPLVEVCTMSSMVSPGAWVARCGPPRATHPMEVVMVSMYIIPVASSCTMQLVHIMATVGSIVASSCRSFSWCLKGSHWRWVSS